MMLVLTLLCRDEADILESMLRFHLAQGVDRIIATDNGCLLYTSPSPRDRG